MKTLPAGLQAHLDTGATTLCWCWKVARRDGLTLGFTDHDVAFAFDGVTYDAATGFTATEIEANLGLSVDNLDVESAISSDLITADDITAGRWDDATVEIWRVNWSDASQRILVRKGSIGEVTHGSVAFSAEIRGLAHELNQSKGNTYQRMCAAVLGDGRCKINLAAAEFQGSGSVSVALDGRYLSVSGLEDFAEGWFTFGVLTFTSGANAGVAIEVRQNLWRQSDVTITLWQRAPLPIAPGDTFTIVAGCDKTFATCKAKFDNHLNFRGFPYIPGNDAVLRVAKKSDTENDGSSFFN
ncbi:DUF2163 domain-containing protein [Kaistia geumhonensis]|uniref:Phage protein (TIGR02218 family) n=1 Tax=Kaistia geumhonensis TaxID=410839 RepID=A0ABU0M5V4_9HYPH|nr:DUF2163 domain-containing protein [Kaistia geumhonensis]MCX5478446.1 DUF2163 domain-containing protein [Kaistia geumhonensis]MDQ0516336.1 putative phage protein (TIGR02218 family) [Kaistia geumhonensis]